MYATKISRLFSHVCVRVCFRVCNSEAIQSHFRAHSNPDGKHGKRRTEKSTTGFGWLQRDSIQCIFLVLPYPTTRIVDENTHSTTICVEIHNISNVKYALHTTRTHICTHIRIIPQLQCPSVSIYNIVARCDVSVMHKWARVCPSNLNRVGWQWCARTLVWGTITMLMMIEYGVAGVGATTAQS